MFPLTFNPEAAAAELLHMTEQAVESVKALHALPSDDLQIGATPKTVVYQEDHITLYRYQPRTDQRLGVPLLIVYALMNRPHMIDLQPDRSLVRHLLDLGLDVYLIDWGYPTRHDRWITLDDYINGYVDTCVEVVRQAHGLDAISVLGVCQGGVFSLCYASMHPAKVKNLITMITPVDFHQPDGLINVWMGCGGSTPIDPALMIQALGNIPGDFMNFGFLMLKPFELGLQKYLHLLDISPDARQVANFLRMEKWIFDSPAQVGEAWREFITAFYLENRLIRGGLHLGGLPVDLRRVTMPVLNIYGENDHLVPPASARVLDQYVPDCTTASFPVGHIGVYVSSKVQKHLPPLIVDWLASHA